MRAVATRLIRASIDVLVLGLAFVGAWVLRFEGALPGKLLTQALVLLPYVIAVQYSLVSAFGGHRHSWRFVGLDEITHIAWAMTASTAIMVGVRLSSPLLVGRLASADNGIIPFGVIGIDFALAILGLSATRALRRMYVQRMETTAVARHMDPTAVRRALLVGAGRAGAAVANEMTIRPDTGLLPVAFVDDNPATHGQTIHGVRVAGATTDIATLAGALAIDEAIITMSAASGQEIRRIVGLCEQARLQVKVIPGLHEIVTGHVNLSRIRPVAIEDLLRRDTVDLDLSAIRSFVQHEVVLVTGAGGSIGAEICRQVAAFQPRMIVLMERAEPALWAVHRELESRFPGTTFVPTVTDACDPERVDQLLLRHRPSTVFHAAAHKHVPLMEVNAGEAIKNNVLGTRTVADRAAERGVERFVMISTDKAVNPTSVMGASKRVAELYVQHLAQEIKRPYVSVRFGNVLGSTGSVVPIFEEQIANGGPVTVTHPDVRRYFMTIPEACQLVLQASAMGNGGEVFVLDMGEPVKIVELAGDLIRLSGLTPGEDIAVEFTGLRPGEKLFEELSLSDENADRTRHPKVWIGRNPAPDWTTVEGDFQRLSEASRSGTDAAIDCLRSLVPEYTPTSNGRQSDDAVLPIVERH